ncbi:hypothetical protein LIER_30690 [Lithospermum erythrorhizon]|uniref:Phorbol-ester/DAG-type domain-containing protein n=1 Tax=Lithospermum erythrorhizon TaxID=34254 RepID=A0AAV3RS74_LITER
MMELDHPFHLEHKLTYYKKVVKRGDNGMICGACQDFISSEHYSCGECKFFLHKLCAERPSEFTHSSHPLHPLSLIPKSPYDGNTWCDACGRSVKGFIYHCAICKFDLDFICAFPDGSKQNHVCHPDHPLTCEKIVKRADRGVVCAACQEDILTEHYSCGECNFFIHKLCVERPLEFTHSFHPFHPVRLVPKNPYDEIFGKCGVCKMRAEGFIYHCTVCQFFLCFACAFPDGSKLRHVCHMVHNLTYEKVMKRADKEVVCAACVEEISGPLANYYSCRKCNFFLHQLCFQRPLEVQSPLHHCPINPNSTLRLLPEVPLFSINRLCNRCQKAPKGFVYHCRDCEFQLDFKCAFPKQENIMQRFVDVHDHPLMLLQRPAKFSCDLCSSEGEGNDVVDESYVCSIPTCNFWIHKWCAFTTLTQRYKDHHQDHPLSLIQGVPEDLLIYDGIFCNVCRKAIYPTDWVSHCARCTYFVHINCMITHDLTSTIKDGVDYLDDSLIKLILNGDEFVHWPPKDISSELIQPFLIGKNRTVDVEPNIRHLSHMQHDMILFQELFVNNDSFFEDGDEEILCDGCNHPITAPYYCCQECNYYLHLACANLPDKIKHSSHPDHELIMGYQNKFYKCFKCNRCGSLGNGFNYFCETCKFSLDLTCAALPAIIMHETHEHPLCQTEAINEGACYACGDYMGDYETIFKCIYCNILVGFDCALLSGSIRHRWDRHHPIDLKFPPHDRPRGHFMCDMCEELIHPMYWLYSCFNCEISFHPSCAPRYSIRRHKNIKFGGELRIHSHDHVLKYLGNPTLKTSCDKCGDDINESRVFECETCYYCICRFCVKREISLDETLV